MKKLTPILLIFVPATVAYANPMVLRPAPPVSFLLAIEIVFSYVVLTFYGMAPVPTFCALVAVNIASYYGAVIHLEFEQRVHFILVEGAVVAAAETASIILLSRLAFFRKAPSVAFKWRFALFAVLGGNFISWILFSVGQMYRTVW